MRHGHGLRKLNRTSEHRLAMLRNMMNSLIEHEVIKTTLPKAKELRRVVEPMITLAKEPTLANKRLAFNRLRDRDSVVKLFGDLGPRFKARPGGYTRIQQRLRAHRSHRGDPPARPGPWARYRPHGSPSSEYGCSHRDGP